MINEKAFTTLEYDKILSILKQHLASEVGAEFADKLRPVSDIREAEILQEQTDEAEGIYSRTGRTPISGFPDVRELVGRMRAALFISARELLAIAAAMRASAKQRKFCRRGTRKACSATWQTGFLPTGRRRKRLRAVSSRRTRFRTTLPPSSAASAGR